MPLVSLPLVSVAAGGCAFSNTVSRRARRLRPVFGFAPERDAAEAVGTFAASKTTRRKSSGKHQLDLSS